jgi:DNA-binding CsgD family transcriptional regulator
MNVLKLTVEGKTLKESSTLLNITEKQVDSVRSQLKKKLGAKTTPELIARAIRFGSFDFSEPGQTDQLRLFEGE